MSVLMSTGYWGIVLGVASIAIAILIYFLQKQIRYPGQLKFAIIEIWKVRSTSPNGYGELSLKYNDYEIKEELNYVKFIVFNNKSYDYSSGDNSTPVRLILPDGCKWVDAKIVGRSKDVKSDIVKKEGRELSFMFSLLRKNEYFEVDGIIESMKSIKNLADSITIYHRIPNVASVKHTPIIDNYENKRLKSRLITMGVFIVFYFSIFFNALVLHPASPLKYLELDSGKIRSMCVEKGGGIVYHKGMFIWSGYSDPISKEEFVKNYELYLGTPHLENTDFFFISFFFIVFIILVYIMSVWATDYRKSNEIKKMMK